MGKKVVLSRNQDGMVIKEVVTLMDNDEAVILVSSENPLVFVSEDGEWGSVGDIANGRVMFEDDGGVFGLDPEEVVHIEVLDGPI